MNRKRAEVEQAFLHPYARRAALPEHCRGSKSAGRCRKSRTTLFCLNVGQRKQWATSSALVLLEPTWSYSQLYRTSKPNTYSMATAGLALAMPAIKGEAVELFSKLPPPSSRRLPSQGRLHDAKESGRLSSGRPSTSGSVGGRSNLGGANQPRRNSKVTGAPRVEDGLAKDLVTTRKSSCEGGLKVADKQDEVP